MVIAFDELENSLCGDLYRENKENTPVYRMGGLDLNEDNPGCWSVFNLTENCYGTIGLHVLRELNKVSKDSLSEQEKENLEKLLKQPRE